jgi:hypothetical protein
MNAVAVYKPLKGKNRWLLSRYRKLSPQRELTAKPALEVELGALAKKG